LERCELSETFVLRHLLVKSEASGRLARPEFALRCAVSGKKILRDEAAQSELTGAFVSLDLLKKSAVSGKSGEPAFFGRCDFTGATVLKEELATSEISGRAF